MRRTVSAVRRCFPGYAMVVAVGGLVASGCNRVGDPKAGDAWTARDSAGVRIVDVHAPLRTAAESWRLEAEPTVRIGASPNDELDQLFGVSAAARLADGRIVIAENRAARLRIYDPAGNHLTDVGRRGGGPGEFRYVAGLALGAGDTLQVLGGPGAVVRFLPDGTYLDQHITSMAGRFAAPHFSEYAQLLPDGSLLAQVYEASRPGRPPGPFRPVMGVVRLAGDERQDTIGWFSGMEHVQVGSDARWVAFSIGDQVGYSEEKVFVGDAERFEIRVFDHTGRLQSIIRRADALRPVTPADLAQFKDEFRERVRSIEPPERMPMYERMLAELPVAPALPPFGALRGDREGNLWTQSYDWPVGDALAWSVFDTDGRWITDVVMPPRFRPLDIGRDYVLGVRRDDDDVELVELYALVRPGA